MPRVFFVPPPPPPPSDRGVVFFNRANRRTRTSRATSIIPGLGWHVALPAPLPSRSMLPALRAYKDPPPRLLT